MHQWNLAVGKAMNGVRGQKGIRCVMTTYFLTDILFKEVVAKKTPRTFDAANDNMLAGFLIW